MSVNFELHYLTSFGYLDQNNVHCYRKKAILSPSATEALQLFAESTAKWANSSNMKGGFMNQGTYDLHSEAAEVKWPACFTDEELAEIEQFCINHNFSEALKELKAAAK